MRPLGAVIQCSKIGTHQLVQETARHQITLPNLCVITSQDEFPERKKSESCGHHQMRPDLTYVPREVVSVGFLQNQASATRICVQAVYLGGDPKKHRWRDGI